VSGLPSGRLEVECLDVLEFSSVPEFLPANILHRSLSVCSVWNAVTLSTEDSFLFEGFLEDVGVSAILVLLTNSVSVRDLISGSIE